MDGFEWDPRTAGANRRRHGVDLADAASVLEDEQALTVRDEIGAVGEPRFLTLGRDLLGRLLVVTWTWRGERMRLISGRRATTTERRQYRKQAR
jgi:uncharacterized DUF497 family protein